MSATINPSPAEFVSRYKTYKGLPPLAGLALFDQAIEPGLSVEESVSRLKRHHYVLRRLHHVFVARLTSEPIYEVKMAFAYHAWLCAEHVTALRTRVGEMREPPLGLESVPHPALERLCDEVLAAPSTGELLSGIYDVLVPFLIDEVDAHARESHPLADQPTRRICRIAIGELEEMSEWGRNAIDSLVSASDHEKALPWLEFLATCIEESRKPDAPAPAPYHSTRPFVFNGTPQRDERFPDPYNMGVNAEAFLYDESKPAHAKVLMVFYKRLREIDVPEMMASIITETRDKPWEYYHDMTRQLWDEARHAMMGEIGLASTGVDWPKHVMINFTWSLGLNTQLKPIERHAVLYFIEQGLMSKTGKRHEWEVSQKANNPLAAVFQDFDWADEVLHAKIGRDWYVKEMPSAKHAVDFGDQCWSRVMMNWEDWRRQGLTEHRNWWPEAYLEYCRNTGTETDEQALAFATTYETTRADLKAITTSG